MSGLSRYWQKCSIIYCVYQGGTIDCCTYVKGPVAQSNAESECNTTFTAGMSPAHYRMLNNEFMNKDTDVVTEQAPLIILDRKSTVCIAKNSKDTKRTRHMSRRMHF